MKRIVLAVWMAMLMLVWTGIAVADEQAQTEKKPADQIRENTYLKSKIEPLLPSGTDPIAAAEGFHKLDHFVASANITKNLDIPFSEFKAKVLGDSHGSLDKAVMALKPELSHEKVTTEVSKAQGQAKELIEE